MRPVYLFALLSFGLAAQTIDIPVDGKPFATFNYGKDANKPFLAPIRSASGKVITRGFPMETIQGESRDHLHHRGFWFTYDDVNGVKFWENDPSYKRPNIGKVVVRSAGFNAGAGRLDFVAVWRAPDDKALLTEERSMTFPFDATTRGIDVRVKLTAEDDIVLGDTKEGAFAIRLAENFTERRGGVITNSDGKVKMVNIWGKRAKWVDYAAEIEGEKLGVAIFDHPANPNFPTYWHARDYGLFSLNPFGQSAFDQTAPERKTKIAKGQSISYHWFIYIHPGDATSGGVEKRYEAFAK
jgi:hypothetical protein